MEAQRPSLEKRETDEQLSTLAVRTVVKLILSARLEHTQTKELRDRLETALEAEGLEELELL